MNCNENNPCMKYLKLIEHPNSLTISEELKINFNDNLYTSKQASKLSNDFNIAHFGETLILTHSKSKIRVLMTKSAKMEIQIPQEMMNQHKVQGLCGNYNGNKHDDKIDRNGQILISTKQFYETWKIQDYPGCSIENNIEQLKISEKICNIIKFPPFSKCHFLVPKIDFLPTCIDVVTKCLKSNQDEGKCR